MKRALQIILGISLFGLGFSGLLTYRELFGSSALSCPSPGAPGTVFGYPACVYGFFMYLAIAGTATWGLSSTPTATTASTMPGAPATSRKI